MTWHAMAQSLIPMGRIGEVLHIFRRSGPAQQLEVLSKPTLTAIDPSIGHDSGDLAFMVSDHGMFGRNDIDEFLQALMDLGWERGLRPTKMDPNLREMAAVRAHLEDMRRAAGLAGPKP